jgi:hypothetical protein
MPEIEYEFIGCATMDEYLSLHKPFEDCTPFDDIENFEDIENLEGIEDENI